MEKFLLFFGVIVSTLFAFSQLLSWSQDFIQESFTPITLTMIASTGNKGLFDKTPTTDVNGNIAFITRLSARSSERKYTKFDWATTNVSAQCMSLGSNRWSYTFTGGLRSFFCILNPVEMIQNIAILFRNGTATKVQRNLSYSDTANNRPAC